MAVYHLPHQESEDTVMTHHNGKPPPKPPRDAIMKNAEPAKRSAIDDIGQQQLMYSQMNANARNNKRLTQREVDAARMAGAEGQSLEHDRKMREAAEHARSQEAAVRNLTHERDVLRNARSTASSSSHFARPASPAPTLDYPIVQHGHSRAASPAPTEHYPVTHAIGRHERSRSPPAHAPVLPIDDGMRGHGAHLEDSEPLKPHKKGQHTTHTNKPFQGRGYRIM